MSLIKEWDFVRVFASLSIVLLHATTHIGKVNGHMDSNIYQFLRVLLTGSTGVFILLSIIIISYIYKDRIPVKFIRKRFLYVLLPFIFFAAVYALYYGFVANPGNFKVEFVKNLKGGFVGWFILPIFQLYILFWILRKTKLDKNGIVLILMIVGLFYLLAVNNGQPHGFFVNLNMKVLFPIWLLYFGIAYFIGKYYDFFSELLKNKYAFFIIASLFILSLSLVKYNFDNGNHSVHSRRLDLVPYVTMLALLLIYIGKNIPHFSIVRYLSKYAFGIYLTHWLVQQILAPVFATFSNPILQIFGLFFTSLIISIILVNFTVLLPFNKIIIGDVKPRPLIVSKVRFFLKDKLAVIFKNRMPTS